MESLNIRINTHPPTNSNTSPLHNNNNTIQKFKQQHNNNLQKYHNTIHHTLHQLHN